MTEEEIRDELENRKICVCCSGSGYYCGGKCGACAGTGYEDTEAEYLINRLISISRYEQENKQLREALSMWQAFGYDVANPKQCPHCGKILNSGWVCQFCGKDPYDPIEALSKEVNQ